MLLFNVITIRGMALFIRCDASYFDRGALVLAWLLRNVEAATKYYGPSHYACQAITWFIFSYATMPFFS
nr:MAG TPA: hypothetical protein [Caudoviricetes sp.]